MSRSLSTSRWSQGWRRAALASTSLSFLMLAAPAALAATNAPVANSLPGNFVASGAGATTYQLSSGSTNTATISVGGASGTAIALQWGGTPPTKSTAIPLTTNAGATTLPAGVTQNSGFSVGAGASLTVTGAGANAPVLLNDASGNPSQIYGSVSDAGTGALFVANPDGVIVGSTGSITVKAGGLGLLGYSQDSGTFTGAGTISVDGTSTGSGGVTIMNGASISGGPLLVASNGAVNVGAAPSATDGGVAIFAGWGVSGAPGAVTPASAALSNSTSTVTLSGGSTTAPITTAALYSATDVTNTGVADLTGIGSPPVAPTIAGTFTNTGVAYVGNGFNAGVVNNSGKLTVENGNLTANGLPNATSGADITNSGVINVAGTTTTFVAGQPGTNGGVTGNFDDATGVIDFTGTGPNRLAVYAANIYVGGTLEQATTTSQTAPLSSSNVLAGGATLIAQYNDKSGNAVQGVVDIGAQLWSDASYISGQAIRILSGGDVVDPSSTGAVLLYPGVGNATDPFFKNAKLGYNLSLFPKTMVEADFVDIVGTKASASSAGSNINLDGVVSTQVASASTPATIDVVGNNINGGSAGGFAVNDGDFVDLTFTGNINDPYGAAAAGSTAFQYNYVPVSVANNAAGQTGTVNLSLYGPKPSTTSAQFVNLLVNGNVTAYLNDGSAPLVPSTASDGTVTTASITPNSSYVNNHLVLQSTGNINIPGPAYWPGLVYLNTVASASDPTSLSGAGSITLAGDFSNVLPAFSTGGTGIFFETNKLALGSSKVTTSNNSWVNFANATQASAYQTTLSKQFFGGYQDSVTPTVTELGLQYLPSGDFQPK